MYKTETLLRAEKKKKRYNVLRTLVFPAFELSHLLLTYVFYKNRQRKLFLIPNSESFSSLHFAISLCNRSSFISPLLFCFSFSDEMSRYIFLSRVYCVMTDSSS